MASVTGCGRGIFFAHAAIVVFAGCMPVYGQSAPPLDSELVEQLDAMGYLGGTEHMPGKTGVLMHRESESSPGHNLYCSGHGGEVILMDMKGQAVHRWHCEFQDVAPGFRPHPRAVGYEYFRRAYLYPNGDLLAQWGGFGMAKLDRHSNILWGFTERAHHDLYVVEDGRIYVLTRAGARVPAVNAGREVVVDFIVTLSPDGEVLDRVSVMECFEHSEYRRMMSWMPKSGDILHTNTIQVLDGRFAEKNAAFAHGNVLICSRDFDMIAVLDLEAHSVVWALFGMWTMPHDAQLLETGNMIIFDNRWRPNRSRVAEFDPLTQEVRWSYGDKEDERFFSHTLGAVQRLPNGNTLIVSSQEGTAFEVTPAGETVWTFVNPHRTIQAGRTIAVLFDLVRIPEGFPLDWVDPSTVSQEIGRIATEDEQAEE